MIIPITCTCCSETVKIKVKEEEFMTYLSGKLLIQDCFPDMSADYREMFISGVCPKCWDKLMK